MPQVFADIIRSMFVGNLILCAATSSTHYLHANAKKIMEVVNDPLKGNGGLSRAFQEPEVKEQLAAMRKAMIVKVSTTLHHHPTHTSPNKGPIFIQFTMVQSYIAVRCMVLSSMRGPALVHTASRSSAGAPAAVHGAGCGRHVSMRISWQPCRTGSPWCTLHVGTMLDAGMSCRHAHQQEFMVVGVAYMYVWCCMLCCDIMLDQTSMKACGS
jgi:hypothetical protein